MIPHKYPSNHERELAKCPILRLMSNINYNGQISPAEEAVLGPDSRAFRYGDGLFETMRVSEGKILFLHRHWERLVRGMAFLGIQSPEAWSPKFFQLQCLRIVPDRGEYRLRFNLWREGAGKYRPLDHRAAYLITAEALHEPPYPLNETGLLLGSYHEGKLAANPVDRFKTLNRLPYVLAAHWLDQQPFDDCLLFNLYQRPVEATSSNLFLIRDRQLLTPTLEEGPLDGVLRSVVLDIAHQVQLEAIEKPIEESDLLQADEVFLTNSIQGIKWVGSYKNITFGWTRTQKLSEYLNFFVR